MKNFKTLYILLLMLQISIFLTGCREYGEKRIVKMLSITEKEVSILVYNYDGEKIQYDKITQENDGIQNTIIDILKKENFDLKLCQYCFVDKTVLKNQITEVFLALNNSKFSPDINLLSTDNFENLEKYLGEDLIKNPIYNFNYKEGMINATIPLDNKIKSEIVINNGKEHSTISETQSTLLNILTNKSSNHRYNFSYNGEIYSADLGNSTAGYGTSGNILTVEIFARLVSYKGMPVGEKSKKEFAEVIKQSMEEEIKKIFADTVLVEQYNLFWYRYVKPFSTDDGVKVDILIK